MKAGIRMVLVAGLVVCGLVHADDEASRLREQLRQTVMQLRQAEDENADLKAKAANAPAVAAPVAQPRPDKASKAEVEKWRSQAQVQTAHAQDLQKQLDTANAQIATLQTSLSQAEATSRDALSKADTATKKLDGVIQASNICISDNADLVKISEALISEYKHWSFGDVARANEPLTGIPRIRFEAEAQRYHARVVDDTLTPAATAQAAAAAAAATAQ